MPCTLHKSGPYSPYLWQKWLRCCWQYHQCWWQCRCTPQRLQGRSRPQSTCRCRLRSGTWSRHCQLWVFRWPTTALQACLKKGKKIGGGGKWRHLHSISKLSRRRAAGNVFPKTKDNKERKKETAKSPCQDIMNGFHCPQNILLSTGQEF